MESKPVPTRGRREEYTEATRQALLDAGEQAFLQDGFQSASLEAISRAARVTRGALYHHFDDKKALFDAVVERLQSAAAEKVQARATLKPQGWGRLEAGVDAYLDVCMEPAYARIVVGEAPAILGAQRYREIENLHATGLLGATLRALKRNGDLVADDIDLLTRMVDAMICELAILLQGEVDTKSVRRRGQKLIGKFLEAFKSTAPASGAASRQ